MKILNYEKLEKESLKEIEKYSNLIVEIPKTKKEFESKFSLKNNEINIDKVEFEEYNLDDISGLIVKLPKTKEEFNERFSI